MVFIELLLLPTMLHATSWLAALRAQWRTPSARGWVRRCARCAQNKPPEQTNPLITPSARSRAPHSAKYTDWSPRPAAAADTHRPLPPEAGPGAARARAEGGWARMAGAMSRMIMILQCSS